MAQPLMPHATASWLVDNTSLSFEQIAEFCGLHILEVQAIADDTAFVTYLLDEARVAAVQGAAFGLSPAMRISYATSDALLTEACARIAEACAALR